MHRIPSRSSAGLFLLGLLLAVSGCRSTPAIGDPAADTGSAAPLVEDPRELRAFHGASALPVAWDSLVAQAAEADAVLLGEMHGHRMGLAFASALYRDVLERRPNTACLSMEFFERDQQVALDDYVSGLTEESTFRRSAFRTESNYPPAHREMVEATRAHDRPAIAANAPRRYVRLSRTDGFAALRAMNDRQRALVEIPDALTEGRYREKFYGVMSAMAGHMGETDDDPILPFYRSQNVWDETMAGSIADAIETGCRPVVHVVGQFHIEEEGGLVTRLRDRSTSTRILTVTTVDEWSDELLEGHADRADIVVYVGPRSGG